MLLRDARHGRLLAYGDSAGVRTCTRICTSCTSTLAHARTHTLAHTHTHTHAHTWACMLLEGDGLPHAGLRLVTMAILTTAGVR